MQRPAWPHSQTIQQMAFRLNTYQNVPRSTNPPPANSDPRDQPFPSRDGHVYLERIADNFAVAVSDQRHRACLPTSTGTIKHATHTRLGDSTFGRPSFLSQRFEISGRHLPCRPDASTRDAEWINHRSSRPVCPTPPPDHPSACLTAPDFQTTVEFLPTHATPSRPHPPAHRQGRT
jgi:hypothetical protein